MIIDGTSTVTASTYPVLLDTITEKVVGEGEAIELFEVDGPLGSGPPPHAHPWTEAFVVLEGRIDLTVGETTRQLSAGDAASVPANSIHSFVITTERARFLSVTDGTGASRFFRDLSTLGQVTPDADHLGAIVEIAKRNSLTSPLFD